MAIETSKISTIYAMNSNQPFYSTIMQTIILLSQKICLLLGKGIMMIRWIFVSISFVLFVTHNRKYSSTIEVLLLFFFIVFVFFYVFLDKIIATTANDQCEM